MAKDNKGKRVGVRKPYLGFCCLAIFFLTVVFAELIAPHDPYEGDLMKTTLPPAWEEDGTPGHETLVTINFVEKDGGTEILFTHEGFENGEQRDMHNQGWTSTLVCLLATLDG